MIICLYHGSTFKNINIEQTRPITQKIKKVFSDNDVYEAYYSQHVCKTLQRREGIDMSLIALLKNNYYKYKTILILATNMIDGEEYQNILSIINKYDVDNKIKITKPLLYKCNVHELASTIINKDNLIVNVAHGSKQMVKEYERLNEILNVDNNYVITLKDDFEQFLLNNIKQKEFTLQPLMLTSGYHVKVDIEQKLYKVAKELGYEPQVQSLGLCKNTQIVDMLILKLKQLILET